MLDAQSARARADHHAGLQPRKPWVRRGLCAHVHSRLCPHRGAPRCDTVLAQLRGGVPGAPGSLSEKRSG